MEKHPQPTQGGREGHIERLRCSLERTKRQGNESILSLTKETSGEIQEAAKGQKGA